jgi:hypothetical protein
MAVTPKALDALDATLVTSAINEVVQRIQEDNPTLDVSRGVFYELLIYYHSLLATRQDTLINDYRRARSLLALEQDPDLADTDLVNDVLSNFRLDRKAGTLARGTIAIILSDDITVTFGRGSIFEARGLQYTTTEVYTAKAQAAQINTTTDRLITATADGRFMFTLEVEAVAEGANYNLDKGTLIVPSSPPPTYVTSYATIDFTSGIAAETNTEVLTRLQEGISAQTLSNRVNMAAFLRGIEAYSRVIGMSIIGYGDAEMLRDKHSIFPVAYGGRVDWYVRSENLPTTVQLTRTATRLAEDNNTAPVWQIALDRDAAPGFYEVRAVRPKGTSSISGTLPILSDTRSYDLTTTDFVPDITSAEEAAYSRYQTAILKFRDTTQSISAYSFGATLEYDVDVTYMPLIADIQTTVSSRDVRHYGADCLVKAPIPCFVQISFIIYKQANEATPDSAAIQLAVSTTINAIGFVGRIYASKIQDAVHGYLSSNSSVGSIDIFGRIRYPDGTTQYIRGPELIQVPANTAKMVSHRTVQFFCRPEDVFVNIETAIPEG